MEIGLRMRYIFKQRTCLLVVSQAGRMWGVEEIFSSRGDPAGRPYNLATE